ncbi:hypothetical protein GJ744_009427 [Endocarpon pusillum]|uniref:Uncharacterized protein n=1 Tax=Endocarpon pusillum TaxID=364733 RepID=A0A8H7AJU8_9EURO|nr:hypothetical protein GJ744_009427 [Endocarpon pusillum]
MNWRPDIQILSGVRTTRHKGLAIPDHLLNTLTLLARLPVSKPVIGSFFLLAWKAVSTNPDIKTSPLLKVRGPERQKSA